jgi:4-aminobutyrate aminotransferase-like enzyme
MKTTATELLELEREYCSFGDTVHYLDPPKIFVDCEGSYLYDERGTPYLDLQMWYSAASFGYKNRRLGEAMQGTGGYVIPPRAYFQRLKQTCDKHKILIVDDGIQIGFYRAGKFWSAESFDII